MSYAVSQNNTCVFSSHSRPAYLILPLCRIVYSSLPLSCFQLTVSQFHLIMQASSLSYLNPPPLSCYSTWKSSTDTQVFPKTKESAAASYTNKLSLAASLYFDFLSRFTLFFLLTYLPNMCVTHVWDVSRGFTMQHELSCHQALY